MAMTRRHILGTGAKSAAAAWPQVALSWWPEWTHRFHAHRAHPRQ